MYTILHCIMQFAACRIFFYLFEFKEMQHYLEGDEIYVALLFLKQATLNDESITTIIYMRGAYINDVLYQSFYTHK